MKVFEVYYESTLIGETSLEYGDAPMGVAFGAFNPKTTYQSTESSDNLLRIHFNGNVLPCEGVTIQGDEELGFEITIVGIPYPLYEEIFPEHVEADRARFL